jgi:hypothetical protein
MKSTVRRIALAGLAGATGFVMLAQDANAATLPPATVSTNPANWTPNVVSADATVRQIVQCGSMMYAVGTFTQVAKPGGGKITRNNAFSFNATTGAISSWNPSPNATVYGVALSGDCSSVYLAGSFSSVGGASIKYLAKVNATSGAADTAFKPAPNSSLQSIAYVQGKVFAGGYFTAIGGVSRKYLASLNPATGAATSYVNSITVSGQLQGISPSPIKVYKIVPNPAQTRLLVLGAFTTVNGSTRSQAFVADLGASSASLDAWYAPGLSLPCDPRFAFFVRSGNWSPDGNKIYLATTGGPHGKSPYCDMVAQFSSAPNTNTTADWRNLTGCDSLYAVAADGTSVYIGGHERWADNPNGCDYAGPGALSRPGVGSIQVANGKANAWNPTRDRGHGADDAIRTAAGLWVVSDTYDYSVMCGHEYHPGICFFPNA